MNDFIDQMETIKRDQAKLNDEITQVTVDYKKEIDSWVERISEEIRQEIINCAQTKNYKFENKKTLFGVVQTNCRYEAVFGFLLQFNIIYTNEVICEYMEKMPYYDEEIHCIRINDFKMLKYFIKSLCEKLSKENIVPINRKGGERARVKDYVYDAAATVKEMKKRDRKSVV